MGTDKNESFVAWFGGAILVFLVTTIFFKLLPVVFYSIVDLYGINIEVTKTEIYGTYFLLLMLSFLHVSSNYRFIMDSSKDVWLGFKMSLMNLFLLAVTWLAAFVWHFPLVHWNW